ncbi:OLC1v1035112C1 [Oldenlandia corymbosa var. corymbosa]|uniref:OLC1v1035112C1 n=1 Tax=Oldenlandia corymbosa var. corymbosa TaxID=529605 RepID=A0AAV1CSY3_OLDCO|nr:OLC1v1035112C1 [Oldenlandia corymbosa var. corymbosa]
MAMESLLNGSFTKPCFSISHPASPGSWYSSSGEHALKCKEWNKVQKQPLKLMNSERKKHPRMDYQHFGSRNSGFVALSRKGSDHYLVNEASEDHSEPKPSIRSPLETFLRHLDAFYRFSRLFAYIGGVLSTISFSLLAVEKISDVSPLFVTGVAQALAAGFLMHIYNNGVNQLADIEIDKVNKPYLPLASGDFTIEGGVILTLSSLIMACWLGWTVGSWPLNCLILLLFLSSTVYSVDVPLLRWKKNAYLAALCIFTMIVPPGLTVYMHIQTFVLGRPAAFPKRILIAAILNTLFSFVVALLKDIPDVEGDRLHGVKSFAVRFGGNKVFWVCIALLQIGYAVAILAGLTSSYNWSKLLTVGSHTFLALKLWRRSKAIDTGNNEEITSFYVFVWRLISAEYMLLPLVR